MATGRPSLSAAASGSWPGATSNQFCECVDFPRGQGVVRVFQVDHPRDKLAAKASFKSSVREFNGDGEAALLAQRGVKPVDDFDGREDFQALGPGRGNVGDAEPVDGADQRAPRARRRLGGRIGRRWPAKSRPPQGP